MRSDQEFLRSTERPPYESGVPQVRIVDLFSGCGGMTLGVAEAVHDVGMGVDVALAVDFDEAIARVYGYNFPKARVEAIGVEQVFDGQLGRELTTEEESWKQKIGPVSWLQGGPPCQGHSDLNNHTRRDDPRNDFYERMARAAEVLEPKVVVIENVPTARNDKGHVVDRASRSLLAAGYDVADAVVSFEEIGVPQKRRRHTILALRDLSRGSGEVLDAMERVPGRDLRWAIEDLADLHSTDPIDQSSRASSENLERMGYLIENNQFDLPNDMRPTCHQGDHSYKSMYGRLRWSEPAQTITTGFGSMGQGRYVHPSKQRT